MNRMIIIGNGFDLAHGMKTSYTEFISYYFSEALGKLNFRNKSYEDELIRLVYINDHFPVKIISELLSTSINDFINKIRQGDIVKVIYKSDFFKNLIQELSNRNWVDLEYSYFKFLTGQGLDSEYSIKNIRKLNREFKFLKMELEKYIIKIERESSAEFDEELFKQMVEGFKPSSSFSILILNFNYTKTAKLYYNRALNHSNINLINIHGTASESELIFGFGDEYDEKYKEFEKTDEKGLLEHIKSFGYLRTSEYRRMVSFCDSNFFEIYSMGHSLGISDRTLLKQLFEHKFCNSIKIFYHENQYGPIDYTEKTYNISSHFENKISMRNKIVPLPNCSPMIQPSIKIRN